MVKININEFQRFYWVMNGSLSDLSNPSFLEKLALDLVRSRKSNYLQDLIYYHSPQSKFIMEDVGDLRNKYQHLLKCTFVRHRLSLIDKFQRDFSLSKKSILNSNTQKCIVYLHGLGSNRIQGLSILSHLPKNFSLLTFDLSGSGKSQGQFTTYGFREKQDIESILIYLYKHKNIREFIIWGRSMGAVASLLFNNLMAQLQIDNSNSPQNNSSLLTVFKCVKCIVADSPFSSFEQISKEIALKKMSVPRLFTQIALKFLQNCFQKLLYDNKEKKGFSPFQIDLTKNTLKPMVPIIFVYSLNDEIVNCKHSEEIINAVDRSKTKLIEKIIIPDCGHNLKRPDNVIQAIFQKIDKHCQTLRDSNLPIIELEKKQNPIQLDKKQNPIKLEQQYNSFDVPKNDPGIYNHTKNVRKKSFWNFQQQFTQKSYRKIQQNAQVPSKPQPQTQIQQNDKFASSKPVNQNTRRSIFDRDHKVQSQKMNSSMTKKRGLSLSSTIQRGEYPTEQLEKVHKFKFSKDSTSKNQFSFNRPLSVQNKMITQKVNEEQSRASSPRKGIARCNAQIMNQNFTKSIIKRPSLGGTKPGISLGGSVQKRSKISMELFKNNAQSKIIQKRNYTSQMPPERDSSTPNSFSTISYSDSKMYNNIWPSQKFQQINLSQQNRSSRKVFEEHFDSQPDIIKGQNFDLRRVSSRQSIKTIDEGQLDKEINESLSSFINNKLQIGFESFSLASAGFNKFKTISPSSLHKKCKESLILTEIDNKQVTEMAESQNKRSTITMPIHVMLRPSTRLYHEKRKKKLQTHTTLINKQNQNLKITNDKYLNDD